MPEEGCQASGLPRKGYGEALWERLWGEKSESLGVRLRGVQCPSR